MCFPCFSEQKKGNQTCSLFLVFENKKQFSKIVIISVCSLLFKKALLYKWYWHFDSKKDFVEESFSGKVWGGGRGMVVGCGERFLWGWGLERNLKATGLFNSMISFMVGDEDNVKFWKDK